MFQVGRIYKQMSFERSWFIEVDAHIAREAEEEETNESSLVKEPEPKRGKPDDDNMDLD